MVKLSSLSDNDYTPEVSSHDFFNSKLCGTLNGNFKEDFFTDNAKDDFGHINACIGDGEEITLKSQGGQLVISHASHLYKNCMWLEFQST